MTEFADILNRPDLFYKPYWARVSADGKTSFKKKGRIIESDLSVRHEPPGANFTYWAHFLIDLEDLTIIKRPKGVTTVSIFPQIEVSIL